MSPSIAQPKTTQPPASRWTTAHCPRLPRASLFIPVFPLMCFTDFRWGGLKIKQARDVLTKLERKVKLSLSLAKDTFACRQMSSPVPLGNTGFSDAIPFIPLPVLPPFFTHCIYFKTTHL